MEHEYTPRGTRQSGRSGRSGSVAMVVTVLVTVAAAGGFVAGMQYQKSRSSSTQLTGQTSSQGEGGQFGDGAPTMNGGRGTVTAVESSSITIKDDRTSTTKTYTITSDTKITDDGSTVTYSDITVGDTVFVMTASSSSTDATQIEVNPTATGPAGQQNNSSSST